MFKWLSYHTAHSCLTDKYRFGLSQTHDVNGRKKRQFECSLNFQKCWWSSENWTNCSNATLILCYSKCKLVSQKLFLITLCRVNLLCGNCPCSPLASHSVMNHDNLYDMWSLQSGPGSRRISIYSTIIKNNKYNITFPFNFVWSNNSSGGNIYKYPNYLPLVPSISFVRAVNLNAIF